MSTYNIYISRHLTGGMVMLGWLCKHGITNKKELALAFTDNQVRKVMNHYHAENGGKLTYELDVIEVDPKPVER